MVFDDQDKCREKVIYIPVTLKVHYVERKVSMLSCKFKSKEALKEIEYEVSCGLFSLVEGELWLGQLIKLTKSGAIVKYPQKAAVVGSIWRWPEKPNEEEYVLEDLC